MGCSDVKVELVDFWSCQPAFTLNRLQTAGGVREGSSKKRNAAAKVKGACHGGSCAETSLRAMQLGLTYSKCMSLWSIGVTAQLTRPP